MTRSSRAGHVVMRKQGPSAHPHGQFFTVIVGIALVIAVFGRLGDLGSSAVLLVALTCVSVVIAWAVASARKSPFAPVGFLYLYSALTVIASVAVGATVGFQGTFLAKDLLTPRVMLVLGLFLAGLLLSALPPVRMPSRSVDAPASDRVNGLCNFAGVLFVVLAAGYRVYQLRTHGVGSWNDSRGTDFSVASQVDIIVGILPLAGVGLMLLADHRPRKWVLPGPVMAVMAIWATASLAIGSRDEVIGPIILLAWAYHKRVRPLRMWVMGGVAALGFILLAAVGLWRVGASSGTVANMVRPISSGTNTTALTVQFVPGTSPYLDGSTYLAALHYAIPFLGPNGTSDSVLSASLRFPRMIGYSAHSGLGYSPIAEAYWNFGLVGAFLAPFVFGLAIRYFFRHSRAWSTHPGHLVYALIIARVPVALRSDFLQQYKGVLMALIVIWLVYAVERLLHTSRAPKHRSRRTEPQRV